MQHASEFSFPFFKYYTGKKVTRTFKPLTKEFMVRCSEFVLGEYNQTNVRKRWFLVVLYSSVYARTPCVNQRRMRTGPDKIGQTPVLQCIQYLKSQIICFLWSLKLRTSNLRMSVLLYDSMPEMQCDKNLTFCNYIFQRITKRYLAS